VEQMNGEDWEGLLNSRIITAYSAGLSVVEITRALGKIRIDYVHKLLRDTGAIPVMVRTDYRRTYQINGQLTEALRNMGYSFGRWCLGWRFDPETAVAELGNSPGNGEQSAVHDALRRDYPLIYFRLYGGKPPRTPRWTAPSAHPSLTIQWDQDKAGYVARVPEYGDVVGIGDDWNDALEAAKTAYRAQLGIYKLNFALRCHENT